ncbi:MAG: hypothetical protein K2N42_03205 [Anaeroplasmataceae bacterium]|nr:hypothetical protein [Anaeroplasmataceae bacterium]
MSYNDDYPLLKDKFNVFRSATYDKVMQMFSKFKTGIIYIGGAWCKNCQAVISIINKTAKKNKIRTILHYDPHFIDVFKDEVDLRDCGDLETKLNYYYLIEKIGYKSETLVQDTLIPRLNVPAIIGVKNGICVGVIDEEYINDTEGLHKEGESLDCTEEYSSRLTELFQAVKEKERRHHFFHRRKE